MLKVEFIDNADSQYDANASQITYSNENGKLFLGDRYAASYVQLKYRECDTVVNCCQDMHGFAKEENVEYLKIDPDDEDNTHFEESFGFIESALTLGKNVVIHCENGSCKSAVITIYFIMVRNAVTLWESYSLVRSNRTGVKIPPRLMRLLIEAEIKLRGLTSVAIEGRNIVAAVDVVSSVEHQSESNDTLHANETSGEATSEHT